MCEQTKACSVIWQVIQEQLYIYMTGNENRPPSYNECYFVLHKCFTLQLYKP